MANLERSRNTAIKKHRDQETPRSRNTAIKKHRDQETLRATLEGWLFLVVAFETAEKPLPELPTSASS
jgi:hypothetical protein